MIFNRQFQTILASNEFSRERTVLIKLCIDFFAIFSVYVDLVQRMVAFTVKVRDVLLDDSTVLFYFFRIMF